MWFYIVLILGILIFAFGCMIMGFEYALGDSIFWHAIFVIIIGIGIISTDLWHQAGGNVTIQFKAS